MLTNWSFQDEAINSTTQEINRQKSAPNLEILELILLLLLLELLLLS